MGESLVRVPVQVPPAAVRAGRVLLAAPRLAWLAAVLAAGRARVHGSVVHAREGQDAARGPRRPYRVPRRRARAVAFCLFRPTLVVSTAVPQQQLRRRAGGRLAQHAGSPTGATAAHASVHRALGAGGELLEGALRALHGPPRSASPTPPTPGDVTDSLRGRGDAPRQALGRAREELSAVPLAGLVLVTDGADNSRRALGRAAARAARAPACRCSRWAWAASASQATSSLAGRDAAHGAPGLVARGRPRRHAERLRRRDGPAPGRGRRAASSRARTSAAAATARRRRCASTSRRQRAGRTHLPRSASRRSPARWSRRTTSSTR